MACAFSGGLCLFHISLLIAVFVLRYEFHEHEERIKIFVVYALCENFLTFYLFGVDKQRAIDGEWRISEMNLHICTLFGAAGAFLGMLWFHHKTSKKDFIEASVFLGVLCAGFYILLGLYMFKWSNKFD